MAADDAETEALIERIRHGDTAAGQLLLVRHQQRLRQMIAVRLDRRLAARLDPSDVVQEVLVEATQKLAEYLQQRPLPFYPWLRQLAWERLVKLHQRHLHAQKRSLRLHNARPSTLALRSSAGGGSSTRPYSSTRTGCDSVTW